MLELNNLVKQYDGVKAVDSIKLKIKKGDIFGFLGPNGAGKTTTIRMIMGIIEPDSGDILLHQRNIIKYGRGELGYLPEDRGLYQKQKLEETVKYFANLRGLENQQATVQINYWLERFDLIDQKNRKIEELSKGNQQKVQFILSLIHDPSLLILDEPFTGLDPINQVLIKDIIQ
jgi:ABC-2 type transport system ATP-binding protein